jgi:NitT/TauT family transport system substrate-binding protein
VDASRVTFLSVSPALREPMLVRREADGITGFVTTSALALKGIGLDHPQQRVMMYYDHGLDLYGGALLTTRAFAERNPAAVRGAVAALIRGFRDTVSDPEGMLRVLRQVEPLTDLAIERERHALNMERVVLTPHVRANGISAVDVARLQTGIRAVEGAFNLPERVTAGGFYLAEFLPPAEQRRLA